jgi:hypothetical protein
MNEDFYITRRDLEPMRQSISPVKRINEIAKAGVDSTKKELSKDNLASLMKFN